MIDAATIVRDALSIAKCPGFLAQGGRALNLVLSDLVLHRNLKVNLVSTTVAVTANNLGPYDLESDYLRTFEFFYILDGAARFLNQANRKQYDADSNPVTNATYPYEFATDLSPQAIGLPALMYLFPASGTNLSLTHRYFIKRADISSPESNTAIPWFEDQDYLVQATAMRMMRITDDSRYAMFVGMCDKLLETHLVIEGDENSVVKEVQLDPRRFSFKGRVRATKLFPW